MDNNKLSDIIKNNQSEPQLKYINEKVNEMQQNILKEKQNKDKLDDDDTKVKKHWWNKLFK